MIDIIKKMMNLFSDDSMNALVHKSEITIILYNHVKSFKIFRSHTLRFGIEESY